jgi:mycofactocin system glycosyltransferase
VRARQRGDHRRRAARRRGDDGELSRTLPPTLRLVLDPATRRTDEGRVLIGGSPLRVVRLTPAGAFAVDGLVAGDEVGQAPTRQHLARRLLDAGMAHPRPPAPPRLRVAIVIPVRDRPAGLAATLAALRPRPWTVDVDRAAVTAGTSIDGGSPPVIVVDDGSRGPGTAAAALAGQAHVERHEQPLGPAAARNTGWQLSDAEVVAFIDADCVPAAGWLTDLLTHFADPDVGAVAPRITPATRLGTRRWIAAYERLHSPLDLGAGEGPVRPRSRIPYVPAAALVVRRSALESVGGFDEKLRTGEDVDFVWRLVEAGWTVRYEPRAVVGHPVRPDLIAWLDQRFTYGRSAAALAARHDGAVTPLAVSAWSAGAWSLTALGRPAAGAAVATVTTGLLAHRLAGLEHPAVEALRLGGLGHLRAGGQIAAAVRRAWWPVTVPLAVRWRRARPALLAALLVPPLLEWVRRRPELDPLRWTAARLADDFAYGAGVWAGAVGARSPESLLPDLASWPGRRPAVERETAVKDAQREASRRGLRRAP